MENRDFLREKTRFFKAISDETRLKIVLILLEGERCVNDLAKLTERAQPTVSLNLRVLEQSGIVHSRAEGRLRYYFVKKGLGEQLRNILEVESA